MLSKTAIIEAMTPEAESRGYFIIDVKVSQDNDIEFVFDKIEGDVDMDDCVALNDVFLSKFDRDQEDYSLTMASAGLDQPFKVFRQFQKAVGTKVEAQIKGGKKIVAVLEAAEPDAVVLKYSVKEAVEGKKKKELVEHSDRFTMDQVNAVRPYVEF
ncbi:MAG: hypothetical protein K5984_05755 [Bacteroidales bacterium]|nr:hypothetical protein [Bacteroidales bacterium]